MQKMLRRTTVVLLILALMFANVLIVSAGNESEDPVLIPVRAFFEDAGGRVQWNGSERLVTITLEDNTYILHINSSVAYRNDEVVNLQYNIVVVQNKTYIAAVDLEALLSMSYLGMTTGIASLAAHQYMELLSIPGITVAIVDAKQGFTWTRGFGFADVADGVPVDELTLFGLASISKTFTATAVMQLVESGVIDLDEPIVTYLPELNMPTDILSGEGDYRNITVRMLLSHASGIHGDVWGFGALTTINPNPDYMDNFIELISDYPMASPEATAFAYANNGVTLLGVLVAEMMGYDSYFSGYARYMQDNVFSPAGMDLTTFFLEDHHMQYLALPYADAENLEELVFLNALPTGGIFSNAHDMARFMHIMLNEGALGVGSSRLLSANSVRQMFERQDFGFDSALSIIQPGLGILHSVELDGFKYTGHGGNIIHYHSNMVFDRDSGLGVFVSVNSISGIAAANALSVLILQNAVFEKTGVLNVPAPDVTVAPVELTLAQLRNFEGLYAILGADRLASVVVRDGTLYIEDMTGAPMPLALISLSDGSFLNPDSGLRFWFVEYDGEMALFLGEFKTQLAGGRLESEVLAAIASEEDIAQLIGTYHAIMKEGNVNIIYSAEIGVDENGIAYMRAHSLNGITSFTVLIPIDSNTFLGGIVFGTDGSDTWLEFSGIRMMKVAG